MKILILFFSLLLTSYSYSQELMNFYIEPSGDNEVTLETLVYNNIFSFNEGSTISYLDNTITVSLCYLNTSGQSETWDSKTHIINLPNGYSSYTVNVEVFGDNDGTPCSYTNLVDTGTITFNYPYIPLETIYIPDNVFEGELEDLGFGDDITNNNLVFTHRIENMTILYLYPFLETIYSLEGIKHFTKLKQLRCNTYCEISNLNVSYNLDLEKLECQNNPLSELDLTNNVNLTRLWAWGMNLTELDVTQNVNLETLTVYNNNINSIDVTQNVNLETLVVSGNNINSIDVSQNVNLKLFYISGNNLENIDISNNIALENFHCGSNLITSLNTSNNINLKKLSFGASIITEVDLSTNVLLERLIFPNGLLADLDISSLINLKYLSAYNNQLTALDFSNNYLLEEASLFNNNLISLNVKNGNTVNITSLSLQDNMQLFCVEVDAPAQDDYPGWSFEDWVVFSEDCSLGIEDVLATDFLIYPNPVMEQLFIENKNNLEITNINIYDLAGRLVIQKDYKTNQLDVSSLKSGLFFVSITTDNGTIIKKLIKY